MPRRKYNPDGGNEYSAPQEKPPRYDLRRRHKILDDPLDKKDDKDMKLSEEEIDVKKLSDEEEILLAKKIAFRRIKTAGEVKHLKDTSTNNFRRENLRNFEFNENGVKSIADTYNNLAKAFSHMVAAGNIFSKIKSSQISPDGRLGGQGFVQDIIAVRKSMSETANTISGLIDTFYDEINSPYWKKKTFEDQEKQNQVKQVLEEADQTIDQAQDKLEEE